MADTTNEKPSINSVLKESLGNLQNVVAADTATPEKPDNMVVVDYKMVTFSLAGKDYAIDIMKVKEIAKAGRFTYVPNALPFVLGVYNLRGDIIPIIDLRLFFNIDMPEREYDALENMLIVSIGELTFGVVVDEIDKVVGIQKSSINPPHPLFGDINIKYIQGVVEVNNRLYILLDIEKIFGSKGDKKSSDGAVAREMSARMASAAQAPAKKQASKAAPAKEEKVDYSFVVDSLASMRKFSASALNDKWMQTRYKEWEGERGKDKTQLQSPTDADLFLKNFYSPCSDTWWDKAYSDSVFKALPDNAAKQIIVWNPG